MIQPEKRASHATFRARITASYSPNITNGSETHWVVWGSSGCMASTNKKSVPPTKQPKPKKSQDNPVKEIAQKPVL
jgi:hypothetical protein